MYKVQRNYCVQSLEWEWNIHSSYFVFLKCFIQALYFGVLLLTLILRLTFESDHYLPDVQCFVEECI